MIQDAEHNRHQRQQDHVNPDADDISHILCGDAHINHACHQQRHAQLRKHVQEDQYRDQGQVFFILTDIRRKFSDHIVFTVG